MNLDNISEKDLQTVMKSHTVPQLKTFAKTFGIKVPSKTKKADLITIIYNFETDRRAKQS